MANIVVEPRTQQTSSLNLVELHPTMQVACREASQMDSIEAVVASKGMPSIGSLQKVVGETDIEKVFRYLLAKMREDLHIDNGLSNDNIRNIAKRLRTDSEIRWWLTIADVTLLCRKITSGEYGKFYGHFSEVEFNECLAKYCRERAELHRLEAEKDTPNFDLATMEEVAYTVDEDGKLVVPEAVQEKRLPPPLYLYNKDGKRTGENPKAWRQKASITKGDYAMKVSRMLMEDDKGLDLSQAIEQAVPIVERGGDDMGEIINLAEGYAASMNISNRVALDRAYGMVTRKNKKNE